MFDKIYNNKTQYVPYEKTVTINQAPTDESVKLLAEFEDKARQKIIDSFVINNNVCSGAYMVQQDPQTANIIFSFRFKLNGRYYSVKETADGFQYDYEREKSIIRLFQLIAEQIARSLFEQHKLAGD